MSVILPPAVLGVLGGGQLGHMFVVAAKTMGYQVIVFDPDSHAPAARFADHHLCAPYTDAQALHYMARHCAAVTIEFENVSTDAMRWLAQHIRVVPRWESVAVAQDRIAEKTCIRHAGLPTVPWLALSDASMLDEELAPYIPGLVKTARLGYDGKGQIQVNTSAEVRQAWQALGGVSCVLEKQVMLHSEVSAVIARTLSGDVAVFPVAQNRHRAGILDMSIVPAPVVSSVTERAQHMAVQLAEALDYVGVLAVEYFVLPDSSVVVNEIAPRPHNSGHYTLEACVTDQFQQQLRTLCHLPLGSTKLLSASVMVNLLGELWHPDGSAPNWSAVASAPNVHLHLYGKTHPRPGRKMGHFTVLSDEVAPALEQAHALRQHLLGEYAG